MSDGLDYQYTVTPEQATPGTYDVRTAPDRLRAYCEALERRIEALEADNAKLHQRVAQLEFVEATL